MPIAKESGSDYKPVSAGTHFARCFGVIALGTQTSNNSKFKPANKVLVLWELPNETYEVEGKSVPMTISREYTLSINKKANLRKDLDSWRGRPFTEEEAAGFPVEKVIDAPCTLSISHVQKTDGGVYAKVVGVSGVPKGMSVAVLTHKPVHYEIAMEENAVFEALPEWVQDKIRNCLEWNQDAAEVAQTEAEPEQEETDDVPFAFFIPQWVPFAASAAAGLIA